MKCDIGIDLHLEKNKTAETPCDDRAFSGFPFWRPRRDSNARPSA